MEVELRRSASENVNFWLFIVIIHLAKCIPKYGIIMLVTWYTKLDQGFLFEQLKDH